MIHDTSITKDSLQKLLELNNSRIITMVGAGGKTSLMYKLAESFSSKGFRTLITTTTHILRPSDQKNMILIEAEDRISLVNAFHKSRLVGLGSPCPAFSPDGIKKWASPSLEFLKQIADIPDIILCEGDGSRGFPVKLPRQQEPVFYPGTDTVIGIIGLSCLGQKTSDVLFGFEQYKSAASSTNKASFNPSPEVELTLPENITVPFLAELSLSPQGLRKNVTTEHFHVVFNQAELLPLEKKEELLQCAKKIRDNKAQCHIVSIKNDTIYTIV